MAGIVPLLALIECSLLMAAQGALQGQGRALVLRFASRDSDFNVPKAQLHKGLRAGSAGSQRLRGPGQFAGGDPAAMAEEAVKEAEALGYKLDKKFPTMAMRWTNKEVINYMKAHPGPWGAVKFSLYSGRGNTPFMLASKEVQFGGGCTVSWNFIKPSSAKEVVLKGFVRNLRYFMLVCGTGFKKK
ncbi:rlmN1 [Symbiodinium microadriaticum]|nr:rlmN1 [Symbiodinium microadriaticum]